MADDFTITTRSEGLLGQIGQWGAALITDEELLEALAAHDAEKDETIAELRLELAKQEDCLALARFDTDELHRIRAGVVAEEPEWAVDLIQYGHVLADGIFIVEHRGVNYSTHQRRIKLGQPETSWVPVKQEGDEQ